MASLYQQRVDKLIGWGFAPFEAKQLAQHYITNRFGNKQLVGYTIEQMRSSEYAYLQNLVKSRRLFVINQRNKLIPEKQIIAKIKQQYINNNYLDANGNPDVWALLRDVRKKAIDSGEYNPIKRKGSHHPKGSGISKGNLSNQRKKRKGKKSEESLDVKIFNASRDGNTELLNKLKEEHKRKFGF